MNFQEKIHLIDGFEELTSKQIDNYWFQSLEGNTYAHDQLKYYYMKLLLRIKPLYTSLDEKTFYSILEQSVTKALDRGLKFQVEKYESYMVMASQTYFKYFLLPETDTLHVPIQLIRAFSKLEEVYNHLTVLKQKDEQSQIELLSKGFEYPKFQTRLLYYSFIKWKNNTLRQVDIDLTVNLLPAPQRIEWEIFYEKPLKDIEATIMQKIENKE